MRTKGLRRKTAMTTCSKSSNHTPGSKKCHFVLPDSPTSSAFYLSSHSSKCPANTSLGSLARCSCKGCLTGTNLFCTGMLTSNNKTQQLAQQPMMAKKIKKKKIKKKQKKTTTTVMIKEETMNGDDYYDADGGGSVAM